MINPSLNWIWLIKNKTFLMGEILFNKKKRDQITRSINLTWKSQSVKREQSKIMAWPGMVPSPRLLAV